MNNTITGPIPLNWAFLRNLEYLDISYNKMTGPLLILSSAQEIHGVEFSGNLFSGDYPMEYFDMT